MSFADLLTTADVAVRRQLGEALTYTPAAGDPETVYGVFDAAYVRVDLGNPGVSSSGPAVFLTLDDLPSDPRDDTGATVTIGGVEYSTHEPQPDGMGGIRLLLHEVT